MPANDLDEDVELLEKEIESAMMRGGTAVGGTRQKLDPGIVNMTTNNYDRNRT